MSKPVVVYWHIHHDEVVGWSAKIQERIDYIKRFKPRAEVPVRLRWMMPVIGVLPVEVQRAGARYEATRVKYKAARAHDITWAKCHAAWLEYETARAKYQPELEALHAVEHPGCPWDGKTLFPAES